VNNNPWIWTASQRRALLVVIALLLGMLSYRAWQNRMYVPDPPPPAGPRANELAAGIDPNTADVAQLAALPQMGLVRAKAIVAYREQYAKDHPGRRAFAKAGDLANVKGIGEVTAESLSQYLAFGGNVASEPAE